MSFAETRFPTSIAARKTGGGAFSTRIIRFPNSGQEQRNKNRTRSLGRWSVALPPRDVQDFDTVLNFFYARNGMFQGFRFRDPADYKSCRIDETPAFNDITIGTGDGSDTTFQIIKTYVSGSDTFSRTITKPVSGTVKVGVNGVEQMSGWTVDTATGIITFSVAPTNGHSITAGFEFDVPVRFDTDEQQIAVYEGNDLIEWPALELMEIVP